MLFKFGKDVFSTIKGSQIPFNSIMWEPLLSAVIITCDNTFPTTCSFLFRYILYNYQIFCGNINTLNAYKTNIQ